MTGHEEQLTLSAEGEREGEVDRLVRGIRELATFGRGESTAPEPSVGEEAYRKCVERLGELAPIRCDELLAELRRDAPRRPRRTARIHWQRTILNDGERRWRSTNREDTGRSFEIAKAEDGWQVVRGLGWEPIFRLLSEAKDACQTVVNERAEREAA